MNETNPPRMAGICAGGYFAAAAVYVGNVAALLAFQPGALRLALAVGCLPVICVLMGFVVLAGRRLAARWAVVVASGFCAIHLIGFAFLFLVTPTTASTITQSLQWQLGTALLFLWLFVLGSAYWLARGFDSTRTGAHSASPAGPVPLDQEQGRLL
jgi:hypothetical protein